MMNYLLMASYQLVGFVLFIACVLAVFYCLGLLASAFIWVLSSEMRRLQGEIDGSQ